MPISKNRRKNGKKAQNSRAKRKQRLEQAMSEQTSGVTLQELIDVLAYQEYQKEGKLPSQQTEGTEEVPAAVVNFDDPDAQAVIRAVHGVRKFGNTENNEENEDVR